MCMCMYNGYGHLWRPEEHVHSPRAGVKDCCLPIHGCGQPFFSPLQEQQAFVATNPFIHSPLSFSRTLYIRINQMLGFFVFY